ncbi:MAG: phosphate acetyltransferase [Chthoniobacter sp.]|jgi:BioD-like phosphotransacetylase family protein|nr:phosphate acetyltransferase [Chthoniobacter sp.]
MNTVTPRVFVAATQQNDGKTTTALGLFAALRKTHGRIGFIKPVGQRFVEVDGLRIDEDSVLIDQTYGVQTPLEAMSPIAVEPDFTRRYIEHQNNDFLAHRIQNSFDRAAWEKEFVIIEGTGHAGVGSVFDLSNARVAHLLGSKVILVTKGGIGKPIDEVALNKALFDKEGVELVGVVLNKVLPEKFEYVCDFARRGLDRLGIELIGAIPDEPILSNATLGQIAKTIRGSFINGKSKSRRRVQKVVIGAMSSTHAMEYFKPSTLIITPGDRDDVILAALSASTLSENDGQTIAGLVLAGDLIPSPPVLELLQASDVPTITSALDSYSVASSIHSMTVKTLPGDLEKIDKIQALIERYVQIDRLLAKL